MFPLRYFSPRYWAERFWPKVGADITADPRALAFRYDPSDGEQAFAWDAGGGAQAFAWDAGAGTQSFTWGADDMATDVRFEVVTSGETISLVGTPTSERDITSWTLRFRIYDYQGGTLLLTPTVTKTTASTGVVTVALTAAQTAALRTSAARDKVWVDFWRTDSGSEKELMRGTLPIRA